jgi:coenzyme F420-reducing hydrogenase delta subunit
MGINEKRVQMFQVSAAEATKFAEIIEEVCKQISELNRLENK